MIAGLAALGPRVHVRTIKSSKEVSMRAVVAAFLAPFLIATPLTQVLAQTGQQAMPISPASAIPY